MKYLKAILCLTALSSFQLAPVANAKSKQETQTGTVVWIQHKGTVVYGSPVTSSNGVTTQTVTSYSDGRPPAFHLGTARSTWAFSVGIGNTLYTGEAINEEKGTEKLSSMLARQGSLSFKPKDWRDGGEVEVRFEEKGMLVHSIYMYVKNSNGKKAEMRLVSIIGPDGVERCQKLGCANAWKQ